MKLIPVEKKGVAAALLYELLCERTPQESISHRSIPTMERHIRFVQSHPYEAWYLVEEESQIVGAIYLTKQREIGISIFKSVRGRGYATRAIKLIMNKHPGRFLANINPTNEKSINMFRKLGFSWIQNTYAL